MIKRLHTYTDEHTAIFPHPSKDSNVTHTCSNGTSNHQCVGRVDRPKGCGEGRKLRVHHLKLPEGYDKCTAQLQNNENICLSLNNRQTLHDIKILKYQQI